MSQAAQSAPAAAGRPGHDATEPARLPGLGGMSWAQLAQTAVQSIGIFLLIQFVLKYANLSPTPATPSAAAPSAIPEYNAHATDGTALEGQYNAIPRTVAPMWAANTSLDVSLYISPSLVMPSLKMMPSESLVLEEKGLHFGDWKDSRDIQTSFTVPKEVQHNGTLWAHIYVAHSGALLDPTATYYDSSKGYHFVRPLTQYLPKKKIKKRKNLLAAGDEEEVEEEVPTGPIIGSFYHPNFTLSVIPDAGVVAYATTPPAVREWIQLESTGARDESGANGWYYPIVYLNTFWQLRTHMTELNDTVTTLPLNIHLNSLANWKFTIITSMDYGMKQQAKSAAQGQAMPGGGDGSEFEQIKTILLDSNIYLLGTTVVVSILHMIFEMLAFKSDVSHWRNKKDNVGVSVRSIMANVFMQTVIFLYLVDNMESTSWMILFGQGMGIVLEAWKVTKTVNVRVRRTPADSTHWFWSFSPYTIIFEDKHKLSEVEKKTQEYDEIAFKYLYRVAVPLLLAYAAYSLKYEEHTSWYSFILTTLVGSVYAYGFLMMVPSLYINYRLKSVAHMAGRAMVYKTLGTFVDDLFAFTIKMPTLHRLATLRDDVIFFIYLYQTFKYKVDHTRVNEFGQGGDEEEIEEKIANRPLEAPAGGAAVAKEIDVAGELDFDARTDFDAPKATGRGKEGAKRRK